MPLLAVALHCVFPMFAIKRSRNDICEIYIVKTANINVNLVRM